MDELSEGEDFYWEGAWMIFTRQFLLRRGYCCGSGCRHCPYEPRQTKGTTTIATEQRPAAAPEQSAQ